MLLKVRGAPGNIVEERLAQQRNALLSLKEYDFIIQLCKQIDILIINIGSEDPNEFSSLG